MHGQVSRSLARTRQPAAAPARSPPIEHPAPSAQPLATFPSTAAKPSAHSLDPNNIMVKEFLKLLEEKQQLGECSA